MRGRSRRALGLSVIALVLGVGLIALCADLGATVLASGGVASEAVGHDVPTARVEAASGLHAEYGPAAPNVRPEASVTRGPMTLAGLPPGSLQDLLALSALGAIVLGLRRL